MAKKKRKAKRRKPLKRGVGKKRTKTVKRRVGKKRRKRSRKGKRTGSHYNVRHVVKKVGRKRRRKRSTTRRHMGMGAASMAMGAIHR